MLVREVVKRVLIVETVPSEGLDLTKDSAGKTLRGLYVVGFEVQENGGAIEFETSNPEQRGALQTVQTVAYASRPWELRRLGPNTTALPLLVFYGAR